MREVVRQLLKESRACETFNGEIHRRLNDSISAIGHNWQVGQIQINQIRAMHAREAADLAKARDDDAEYIKHLAEWKTYDSAFRENSEELQALQKEFNRMQEFLAKPPEPKTVTCPYSGELCGGM